MVNCACIEDYRGCDKSRSIKVDWIGEETCTITTANGLLACLMMQKLPPVFFPGLFSLAHFEVSLCFQLWNIL